MSTENGSTNEPFVSRCDPTSQNSFYMEFNQISLIPAVIIIMILCFLTKRTNKKSCLDGRPGIQVPVDFLTEDNNRFSYVAIYGGMAIAVTNMFASGNGSDTVFKIEGHPFIKVFQNIVTVVCIGTIYLPIFMCLSTNAKLLGSIFGFLYTSARFAGAVRMTEFCPIYEFSTFPYWPIFFDLPAQIFLLIVSIRFVVIFVKEVRARCCRKRFVMSELFENDSEFTVSQHYVNHVKTLLRGVHQETGNRKWYVKGRNFVYQPEPHFKYSVAVLSCVLVAGVIIYEFVVLSGGLFVGLLYKLRNYLVTNKWVLIYSYGMDSYDLYIKSTDIGIASFIVSMIVGALFMYFQMYRMLVSHRSHVIKLIKGDRRFLPNKLHTPHVMVGMSLRFAGYQVAYFLWGFVIIAGVIFLITIIVTGGILFIPLFLSTNDLKDMAGNIGLTLLPTVLMAGFIFVLQQFLARFVFKDRSIDSKVVNIHNRRLFLLVSFFFFFFNILVGLISCLLRILKGMVLGILFIGRIDRPLIMKGFTNLDSAYTAYIGFLHLQVAHKHPVVRVFSHLLWSGMRRKKLYLQHSSVVEVGGATAFNGWTELRENPTRPRVSASALNKWFIAVTVIRNPVLIYNRKGFLKHIVMGIPNRPSLVTEDGAQEKQPESNGDVLRTPTPLSIVEVPALGLKNSTSIEHKL